MTSPHEAKKAELVRRLAEMSPRARSDAFLEEVDGKVLVRSLPAEDVYSTIIDIGLADSTEIIQYSTAEQFRTYVDLAAWQKDRLDPLEIVHWLRAARGDDDEAFLAKLASLDIELLELIYKKLALIHDWQENPDVDTEGVTMETPDGKFLVEFTVDGVDEAAMRRLTFDLMANNPFELTRFLEAVRWESPIELEEAAFQFRQSRLQDLGFPPLDEAIKVFAWVDPEKVKAREAKSGLVTGGRVDYVSSAFRGLDETERLNLESEVRYLVNCVLVAEGAEPGDPPSIRRYSEHSRDYLDLGLEHLTGGDPEFSPTVVRERSLKEIFQVGFSLTLRLKRQVERLAKEPGAKFGETWLALDEETAMLSALQRKRPLKALKVSGAEPVPFRSRKELADAEVLLSRVRTQRAIFAALLGPSPAEVIARFGVTLAELTPQRLFAATAVMAELDEVITVAPVPALRVTEFLNRVLEEKGPSAAVRASAGARAVKVLSALVPESQVELEVMVARTLSAIALDVGAVWVKDGRVPSSKFLVLPIVGELPL
jgi:Family of unknown function (DUF6178)